jgi:hypothetical protein
MRLDLRKRGSRLWESNPRPTHQEDAASPPPPLHQHRQHTPRLGKHPAAWENAVRHARSHARPARARWPRGTSITRRCSAPRPGCPTLWPPDAATPPPRPLPVSHSGHGQSPREPRRREHARPPPPRPATLPITVSGTFRTGLLGDADSNVASGTAPEPDSGGSSPVPIVRGQPADGEVGEDLGDLLERQRAPGEQLVEGLEAAEHP